ncbi:MAG: addiction module protein [Nitrospira sp.]|nr:addiction module protein [Nitrospira sp.]
MNMNEAVIAELLKLSPAERIQLAEDLWDSVATHPEHLPALSDDQRKEIERRLAEHSRNPDSALSWEDVRARLWAHLG